MGYLDEPTGSGDLDDLAGEVAPCSVALAAEADAANLIDPAGEVGHHRLDDLVGLGRLRRLVLRGG
ncbi:MAG TPA: hypothetical protein VGP46_00690 [Acidimicrobiales bacterium]|nr:hypothetical protein [Acidimicrobiales bacterium]